MLAACTWNGAARDPPLCSGVEGAAQQTDKNDGRGLAQLFVRWYRAVYVKSEQDHRMKLLLNARRLLKRKLLELKKRRWSVTQGLGLMDDSRVQRSPFVQCIRARTPMIP
jgi:transposase